VSIVNRLLENIAEKVTLSGELVRDEIRAGLSQTRNALRVQGATARPIYPNTVAHAGPARLVGWSFRETTGSAPATVTVYDSRDASGDVLATVNVAAGASSNHGVPVSGVSAGEAVFVAVTGAVLGSIYLGAVD
jgi:hypothetical protein